MDGTAYDVHDLPLKEDLMLTRRDVLLGSMGAAMLMRSGLTFAKAAQPATPVNFDLVDNPARLYQF
jgi:hypothetical protein